MISRSFCLTFRWGWCRDHNNLCPLCSSAHAISFTWSSPKLPVLPKHETKLMNMVDHQATSLFHLSCWHLPPLDRNYHFEVQYGSHGEYRSLTIRECVCDIWFQLHERIYHNSLGSLNFLAFSCHDMINLLSSSSILGKTLAGTRLTRLGTTSSLLVSPTQLRSCSAHREEVAREARDHDKMHLMWKTKSLGTPKSLATSIIHVQNISITNPTSLGVGLGPDSDWTSFPRSLTRGILICTKAPIKALLVSRKASFVIRILIKRR